MWSHLPDLQGVCVTYSRRLEHLNGWFGGNLEKFMPKNEKNAKMRIFHVRRIL